MSLKIENAENFSDGLKRAVQEECGKCVEAIDKKSSQAPHEAVHELRKSFKKIRAVLRLIRQETKLYKRENVFFRDLGRSLSELRDASALIEALDYLIEEYDDKLYKRTFQTLRKGLTDYRDELSELDVEEKQSLEKIKAALETKMEEVPGWHIEYQEFGQIEPGLTKTYERGLSGYKSAKKHGKPKDFHEWRKRAKYLRYHLDILNRLWPRVLSSQEKELHKVTDFLGMTHDLTILESGIEAENIPFEDEKAEKLFFALLHQQRDLLMKKALLLGKKLYLDSPEDFIHKLKVYWQAHQKQQEFAEPVMQ